MHRGGGQNIKRKIQTELRNDVAQERKHKLNDDGIVVRAEAATSYGSGAGVSRVRPGSVTAVVYRPMHQLATRATMPQAMSAACRGS